MATIDELVAKYSNVPGDIKIRNFEFKWDHDQFFVPYFKNKSCNWLGLSEVGDSICFAEHKEGWQLYTEPKKKIKLYKWAVKHTDGEWGELNLFYESAPSDPRFVDSQRLDYTMIEVEE